MSVEQKRKSSSREAVALNVMRLVESSIADRVLVLGSLPPMGRDLELIVRPAEQRAIADRLSAEGFARRGLEWAWFFDCTAYAIELIPAERLSLPDRELSALFAEAKLLDSELNLRHVVRPAPHHLLLLQARRFVREGRLVPKRRARIASALSEEPEAWASAKARAKSWGLVAALDVFERTYSTGTAVTRWARARALLELVLYTRGAGTKLDLIRRPLLPKMPRRNRVVAISGLDGAGKSFQTKTLRDTLELLVVPAVVEWKPLGQNRTLHVLRSGTKLLRPRAHRAVVPEASGSLSVNNAVAVDLVHRFRERSAVVTHVWVLVVALANAAFHRRWTIRHPWRGRIVIYDRFVCDSSVQLDFWYGRHHTLAFEKWLLRALSPKTFRSFFLKIPPEVAVFRRDEYPLSELRYQDALYRAETKKLGIVAIDAERPPAEISAEIARAVWTALPPHTERVRKRWLKPSPES